MTGGCHCGAVRVQVARKPDYINDCNCTLCANAGAMWGYYDPADVSVEGETASYVRRDYAEPAVEAHFCPNCGASTHWTPRPHIDQTRMGVNMRIFDPRDLSGVEVRFLDGFNWDGTKPAEHRRPTEIL